MSGQGLFAFNARMFFYAALEQPLELDTSNQMNPECHVQ